MRVLVGTDVTVSSPPFVGSDGETPADADNVPNVEVTHHGVTFSLTGASATDTTGVYSTNIAASSLELIGLTWTGYVDGHIQTYTQTLEVVGGFYATVAELRAMPGLGNQDTYPTSALVDAREEFERLAEDYLGVAWVPRYELETVRGGYGYGQPAQAMLRRLRPRTIRYLTFAGTVIDDISFMRFTLAGALDWSWTTVSVPFTVGSPGDIVIGYEHGYDAPPEQLRRACREYVRSRLLKSQSGVSRDVISEAMGDGGFTRYSTPDRTQNRPTGYIDVDLLLNSVGRDRVPGLA